MTKCPCGFDHDELKKDENWFNLPTPPRGDRAEYDFPEGPETHYFRNCPANSTIVRTSADVTRRMRVVKL